MLLLTHIGLLKTLNKTSFYCLLYIIFILLFLHAVVCPSVPAATVGFLQAAVLRLPAKDRRTELPDVPPLPVHDPHDTTPLSPLSQSSSGYFSNSVSTVTLSDVLQPSSSSSSLLGAETALPTNPQQQGADRNDVVTSPPQCGAKSASHNSANHSGSAELSFSDQKLVNSGGGEGLERLEILVDEDERSHNDMLPHWLAEGACITVGSNKTGTVRYVGTTQFADGVWVGVELDTPVGKCPVLKGKFTEMKQA